MEALSSRKDTLKPELMTRYMDADLRVKTGDGFKKFFDKRTGKVYNSDNPSYSEAPELYKSIPAERFTKVSFKGGGKMKAIKR